MVVYVNKLTLTGEADELERIYQSVSEYFREQPGFIRFQLVRSTTDPNVYINIAEWTDEESFRRAVRNKEFQSGRRVREVADGDSHVCEVVFRGEAR